MRSPFPRRPITGNKPTERVTLEYETLWKLRPLCQRRSDKVVDHQGPITPLGGIYPHIMVCGNCRQEIAIKGWQIHCSDGPRVSNLLSYQAAVSNLEKWKRTCDLLDSDHWIEPVYA